MLDKKRTAIIFTANTPHLAHANLMIDSLRNPDKGNFQGDLWVISTGLSDRAKNFLESQKIFYLINDLQSLFLWDNWKEIAKSQPEYLKIKNNKSESESLKESFYIYRNKRMSKLIILDWIEKFGDNYDFIALGDNDLYFQKDIGQLFDKAYANNPDKCSYCHEQNEITAGSWIWKKDFNYARFYDINDLDFGKHEINIGFILGKPCVLGTIFKDIQKEFYTLPTELFTKYFWHDQDLVRLNRAKYPNRYSLLEENDIVHLCNGGETIINEIKPGYFKCTQTDKIPYIIHFAGGQWKKYDSIKDTYLIDPDTYYFSIECTHKYDTIKNNTRKNIFDQINTKYFTKENKEKKYKTRKKWTEIIKNNKKRILLSGWLKVSTHKSIYDAIHDFFISKEFNMVVLNGNVADIELEDILCEDFPKIISSLTQIIYDTPLIRYFGVKFNDIPEVILQDGIIAAKEEYNCSEVTARAIANLIYIYFSDAIEYYNPDLMICICTTGLAGKIIKRICQHKQIPLCDMEWGVLPGTITFDYKGHMAESWIAEYSDFFNNLPLLDIDMNVARNYLNIANNKELSRNVSVPITKNIVEQINILRQQGKKVILYMESNSAGSGNTLADITIAKKHSPIYFSDVDAYEQLEKICIKHEDWHILYKPHPISITRGIKTKINKKNTTLLYEGGLSESLELADISITLLSQSAYISLIKEKPVVLLGRLQLNGTGSAYELKKKEELEDTIKKALYYGYSDKQKKAFLEHVARVLKYYVYSANPIVKIRDAKEMAINLCKIINGNQEDFYLFERKAYLEQIETKTKIYSSIAPMVSVIIPVYNTDNYVSSTLDSICKQSYTNIEILCVNNGSTDDSQVILEYYANRDNRIKILNSNIPNLAQARNIGLQKAKGKYIYFIDSDDILDTDSLEKLVKISEEKNSDLIYFFYKEMENGLSTKMRRPRFYTFRRFFPENKIFQLSCSYYKFFIQYPFTPLKFMKRKFMLENNLFFNEACKIIEDNPHNIKTLLSAKNPYVLNEQIYTYRIRSNSLTNSKTENCLDIFNAIDDMNKTFLEHKLYYTYQQYFVPYKIYLLAWGWNYKKKYFDKVKEMFEESDLNYFINDDVWSFYELPSYEYIEFIKSMIEKDYTEFCNNLVDDKRQPWQKISKLHLYSIKICEKLHIINFAIRVKRRLIRKK